MVIVGIGDAPNLCVIKDVDPTDVYQGTVGDCWLLGAISSLAEFDGAIKRLFKKTKLLDKRPLPGPNMYTIVLCDLETWKPKIYHIDERLPVKSDSSGKLLSCRLSGYGELWPALLEKAMAIHCGGWDAIHGAYTIVIVFVVNLISFLSYIHLVNTIQIRTST